ncbi:MAG: hypothetical protein ACT443_08215 [Gemmatimonadota bacterium]
MNLAIVKRVLFPVAIAWAVLNVGGAGYAAYLAEPVHAGVHGAVAIAFGIVAYWLRRPSAGRVRDTRVAVLEDEVSDLQRQLDQAREERDFAERLLERRPDPERVRKTTAE